MLDLLCFVTLERAALALLLLLAVPHSLHPPLLAGLLTLEKAQVLLLPVQYLEMVYAYTPASSRICYLQVNVQDSALLQFHKLCCCFGSRLCADCHCDVGCNGKVVHLLDFPLLLLFSAIVKCSQLIRKAKGISLKKNLWP